MTIKSRYQIVFTLLVVLTTFTPIYAQAVLSAKEIARNSLPSVVLVICDDGKSNAVQGSGFFIRPGIIVTNYHVVEGMTRGVAQIRSAATQQKTNFRIARIIAVDEDADLAILSAPTAIEKSITPLRLAPESYAIQVGETVFALGNPEGLVGTISPGIISASLRSSQRKARIQITAPISQGSSGGPVVNDRGQVIGVAVGSISEGQNLNFAIPVSLVYDLTKTAQFPSEDENLRDRDGANAGQKNGPLPWIQNGVAKTRPRVHSIIGDPDGESKDSEDRQKEARDYWVRGFAHFGAGRFTEAIDDYNKAIQLNPQHADYYLLRGYVYKEQENYSLAIADFTKAIQLSPQHPPYYGVRGDVYKNQKNYNFAIADFTKAIQLNPQHADYYASRGDAYSSQKSYNFAITDFTKAIELNPKDANYYYLRGRAYEKQENYNFFAIADYSKAIQLNPQNAYYYSSRGRAYQKQENYNFAIADYTKAIQLNPQDADYYYFRGWAYEKQENYNFAIADYTKAIQLDPQNADYYYFRGTAYCFGLRQKTLANADLKRAVELGATDVKECR